MQSNFIKQKILVIILALSIILPSFSEASEKVETPDIIKVQKIIEGKVKEFGTENVLVIFDIDHTLLTPFGDLGASFWFKWQVKLLNTEEKEMEQLANNYGQLDSITRCVLENTPFRPVEKNTVNAVDNVKKLGTATMAFTARSPSLRTATEHELNAYQISFKSSHPGKSFDSWFIGKEKSSVFTLQELETYGLKNPRTISYKDGILMGNEQNKGAILWAFLNRFDLQNKYKAIITVDDSKTNTKNFLSVITEKSKIDITAILYTAENQRFEQFNASNKWPAIAAYKRNQNIIESCVANLAKEVAK